jgi:hypothetical protein
MMIAGLNEFAYTELILLIDDKTSRGKVVFNWLNTSKARFMLKTTQSWHGNA